MDHGENMASEFAIGVAMMTITTVDFKIQPTIQTMAKYSGVVANDLKIYIPA